VADNICPVRLAEAVNLLPPICFISEFFCSYSIKSFFLSGSSV
jgi:hypothetical protein